jgi:membrane protease YdiL (CAAX protease family)
MASAIPRLVTALEVLLMYAGILLYIWRWQATYPRAWIPLCACLLASHLARRETLRDLGLTTRALRPSARFILPLAVALYLPLVSYGFASSRLALILPTRRMLVMLLAYAVWCLFQQYLTQSYFHRRLMCLFRSPHASSLVVGLIFGAVHLPNPILTLATTVGGFIFAEAFARYRNIWPLALAQAVGGFLIAALSPEALIHNMRVGPGYYFYRLP